MSNPRDQYTEFRVDGWPLCPQCGNDELWSDYTPFDSNGNKMAPDDVEAYIAFGQVSCYLCQWQAQAPFTVSMHVSPDATPETMAALGDVVKAVYDAAERDEL